MEILFSYFTPTELCHINKVRISMNLLTLADITMQNGRTVLPDIRKGISYRRSSLHWPRQPLVKKIFHSHTLGRWKSTRQDWDWSTNSSQTVLQNSNNQYLKLSICGSKFRPDGHITVHCEEMLPVDISMVGNVVKLISTVIVECNESIRKLDNHREWLPNHELPRRLEKKIVKLIKKHRLIYGSDASTKNNRESFAWGILDQDNPNSTLIQFSAHLHGDEEQVHSNCGELLGLLATTNHINYIRLKYNLHIQNRIQLFIYTNSAASIPIATNKFYLTSKTALENDIDIKSEVRKLYSQCKTNSLYSICPVPPR